MTAAARRKIKVRRIEKVPGFRIKNKAKDIYRAFEEIANQSGVKLPSPRQIVDAAADPRNLLHSEFEWDDSIAADKCRLDQARYLLRAIDVIYEKPQFEPDIEVEVIRARAFSHTQTGGPGGTPGYRKTLEVLDDAKYRAELLEEALSVISKFKAKYKILEELSELLDAVNVTLKKHRK